MAALLLNAVAFLGGLVLMEGVAWATHRYLMHGWLWSLHRSHHVGTGRGPELNDLFGLLFAALSLGLFLLSMQPGLRLLFWVALGMSAYGLLYAVVHDGLVHRRFPFPAAPRRGYLARLTRAHHLHHVCRTRAGAVSFGFLLARDPERLALELQDLRSAGR